jgi:hypothetical protein
MPTILIFNIQFPIFSKNHFLLVLQLTICHADNTQNDVTIFLKNGELLCTWFYDLYPFSNS